MLCPKDPTYNPRTATSSVVHMQKAAVKAATAAATAAAEAAVEAAHGVAGRRPTKVAAIAFANKIARMVWAMMARASATRNRAALA
jgi:hypothetical protein